MALDRSKQPVTLEEALQNGDVFRFINNLILPKDGYTWANAEGNDFTVISIAELESKFANYGLQLGACDPFEDRFCDDDNKGLFSLSLTLGSNESKIFGHLHLSNAENCWNFAKFTDGYTLESNYKQVADLETSLENICKTFGSVQTTPDPFAALWEEESEVEPNRIRSCILKTGGSITNNPEAVKNYPFGSLAAFTHKGENYKDHNEDRVVINEVLDEKGTVVGVDIFVIDGMGGYKGGEKAAQIFAEECKNCEDFKEMLSRIQKRLSSDDDTKDEGGVCWTALKIRGNKGTLARMGDTRGTVWTSLGKHYFNTPDESPAYAALMKGTMTLKDDRYYKIRNQVSNALQAGEEYEFDEATHVWTSDLQEGDVISLRSDGITDNFTEDEEMGFMEGFTAQEAMSQLFKKCWARMAGTYQGDHQIIDAKSDNMSGAVYIHGKTNKVAKDKIASVIPLKPALQPTSKPAPKVNAPITTLDQIATEKARLEKKIALDEMSDEGDSGRITGNVRRSVLLATGAVLLGLGTAGCLGLTTKAYNKIKHPGNPMTEEKPADFGDWTQRTSPVPTNDEAATKELKSSDSSAIFVITCGEYNGDPHSVATASFVFEKGQYPESIPNDTTLSRFKGFEEVLPHPLTVCKNAEIGSMWEIPLKPLTR